MWSMLHQTEADAGSSKKGEEQHDDLVIQGDPTTQGSTKKTGALVQQVTRQSHLLATFQNKAHEGDLCNEQSEEEEIEDDDDEDE